MEKYDWIVAICNTAGEGVDIFKFQGTKQEMKEKLLSLIEEDRYENDGSYLGEPWECGTESVDEISEISTIKEIVSGDSVTELYGYGCYQTFHIDYTAREVNHIETI